MRVSGNKEYAGLFGYNKGSIYALNVYGEINSSYTASISGGICGNNSGTIVGCSFSGTVNAVSNAGGIAGYTNSMTTQRGFTAGCYSIATSVTASKAGGIVGVNDCSIDNGKKGNYYCFWQAGASVPTKASDYKTETCAMFTADQGISEAQVTQMNNALTELGYTTFQWKYTAGNLLPAIEMIP